MGDYVCICNVITLRHFKGLCSGYRGILWEEGATGDIRSNSSGVGQFMLKFG